MTPPDHNGPFVTNDRGPGLLRRLLRGGGTDPAAPHEHTEASTSEMHERASTERTRRSTTRSSRADGRGLGLRMLLWIVRKLGVRLTIAAVAVVLVLVGSIGDDDGAMNEVAPNLPDIAEQFSETPAPSQPQPGAAPTTPAPNGQDRGTMAAIVDRVQPGQATITDPQGNQMTWRVPETRVYDAIAGNTGERVIVYWTSREDGDVEIVGVAGPAGMAVPPPAQDAA